MNPKVYIDGKEGTTGLQIYDRLASRGDIELLLIDEKKRKDPDERKKLINAADITFLCLPDAAAKEAVSFVEKDSARIIDASTAHRTAPGWAYGIPELSDMHKDAVVHAKFTANPGCHASGFVIPVYPLVASGMIPKETPLTVFSLTGYSGGGKKMIAEFESRILALIDGMVDYASDDELFASGYLRGHLTLAIAELESGDDHSAQAVHTTVSQSLEKAIGAGELSPRDQALVTDMWENLFQQASQQ